jgi:uncharacterized protein YecT (DUF1311 family)
MNRLLFLVFMFPLSGLGASFDCRKASTPVERLVCSDEVVSYYDERLSHIYKNALAESADARLVMPEQRRWLVEVRDACKDAKCLVDAYFHRIEALRGGPAASLKRNWSAGTDKISVVCGRAGRFMLVRERPDGDDTFLADGRYQRHTINWDSLLIDGAQSADGDFVYRAGSRKQLTHCGALTAIIEYGYLNPNPMGMDGAEVFPILTIEWNARILAGPLMLTSCPVSPRFSDCPKGHAMAVIVVARPTGQKAEIAIEAYWEDEYDADKVQSRAYVDSSR